MSDAREALLDLAERLTKADRELLVLSCGSHDAVSGARLKGKRQGVDLALSYVNEALVMLRHDEEAENEEALAREVWRTS